MLLIDNTIVIMIFASCCVVLCCVNCVSCVYVSTSCVNEQAVFLIVYISIQSYSYVVNWLSAVHMYNTV